MLVPLREQRIAQKTHRRSQSVPPRQDTALTFRHPTTADGTAIWELVRATGVLDVNSCYAYLVLCEHFADTCLVAERGGELVGFVTAYQPPGQQDTIFVWQIGVAESARKQGVAAQLLQQLLALPHCKDVQFLETTISPSNQASARLFQGLARDLTTDCQVLEGFSKELFPSNNDHESEPLYRIGPFKRNVLS